MAKYTQMTGNAGPNGQLGHGEPTNSTEVTHPGPVGSAPALPRMHEKAHASLAKQRTVLHRFGNK